MNVLATLRDRFSRAISTLGIESVELPSLTALVLPSQDGKFGDYPLDLPGSSVWYIEGLAEYL